MISQTYTPNGANAPARSVIHLTADDLIALGDAPLQLCAVNVTMPDGKVGIVAFTISLSPGKDYVIGKVSDYSHHTERCKTLGIRAERRPAF